MIVSSDYTLWFQVDVGWSLRLVVRLRQRGIVWSVSNTLQGIFVVTSTYAFSFSTNGPYDLRQTLSCLATGPGDPAFSAEDPANIRMALRSPDGFAVLSVSQISESVHGTLEGDDVDYFAPHLPRMLGLDFQIPPLKGRRVLQSAALRYQGLRLPKAPLLFPRIVQVMLQQLISFRDAAKGWRTLLRRHGLKPDGVADVIVPPTAKELARLPSHEYVDCGILPQHGRRIAAVARHAKRIESTWLSGSTSDSCSNTCRLLGKIPGIGPWTLGYLSGSSMGDADAVMPGDYSLPGQVSWFFEREAEADDDRMLEILEPFRPWRYYALLLVIKAGQRPPRRGPRSPSISRFFGS